MDSLSTDYSLIASWEVLLAVFVMVILWLYFSFITLCFFFIAAITGYYCAKLLLNYGDETLSWDISQWFGEEYYKNLNKRTTEGCFKKGDPNCLPWKDLYIPEPVNEALEELIEQILDNYINGWYKTEINGDAAFVNEIRYHIRYSGSLLFKKIMEIDLTDLILSEVTPIAVVHCERVVRLEHQIDKKILTPHMIETKILEELDDLHYTLTSRQNELHYLRQLADLFIESYVDESRVAGYSSDNDSPPLKANTRQWPSRICHHFLRELIVFSFLLPLLDLIADPDTINHLLILLFGPESLSKDLDSKIKKVEFLYGLTESESSDASGSLLQLKLSEVLRDMRNLQMFSMYLKDVHGPLNELCFLLHSGDVHERMLSLQKEDEGALSEIHYDTWEIFRKYVHEGAQHKVSLPKKIFNDFRKAVEKRDAKLLDRALEKAFQLVYRHLQRDYLLPFCQSECYFGHLCGSPPVSVDDLIATGEYNMTNNHSAISESTFSLSQFRRRLWKVIMPSSTDGSIDSLGSYSNTSNALPSEPDVEACSDASLAVRISRSENSPFSSLSSSFGDVVNCDSSESGIFIVRGPQSPMLDQDLATDRQVLNVSCDLPLFDLERDMNRWVVTIPHIDSRRDSNTGKNTFVYVVCIERFDLMDSPSSSGTTKNDTSLNKWSVIRRYNEFYILESKLMEFHGVLLKTQPLPPRKPFSKKTREFIETHRLPFQRFLQLLTQQSLLKKSDLLFAFLTSDQEFRDNIQLSGLNPWNMVRKMPGKFSRERGQNLRPFLLSLLANTLASQPKPSTIAVDPSRNSDFSEASLASSHMTEGVSRSRFFLISSIFGNNFPKAEISSVNFDANQEWTRSLADCLLFLVNEVYRIAQWMFVLFASIHSFACSSFDLYVNYMLRKALKLAFLHNNCVKIIRLIQESLFGCNTSSTTDQEKVLRSELALRRTLEYLEEELPSFFLRAIGLKKFRLGTSALFRVLQYPRLNKQLSYVLLDVLVQKLITIPEKKL